MKTNWPKNENIMSWDPEHMELYWLLCSQHDQYPQLDLAESDVESQRYFDCLETKNDLSKVFLS